MEAGFVAFAISLGAFLIGVFAELHLIGCLKDFHPAVHRRAGSPRPSQLLSRYDQNWTWWRFILLRRFLQDRDSALAFRVAFEVAFICAWLRCLGMSCLFVVVLRGLIVNFRH